MDAQLSGVHIYVDKGAKQVRVFILYNDDGEPLDSAQAVDEDDAHDIFHDRGEYFVQDCTIEERDRD